MENNASPKPLFDTDEPAGRHFVCELPIHPEFEVDDIPFDDSSRQDGGQIKELTARQKEVLKLIQENNQINRK